MIKLNKESKYKVLGDIITARMDNEESAMQVLEQQIVKIEMATIDLPNEAIIKRDFINNVTAIFFNLKPAINYDLPY